MKKLNNHSENLHVHEQLSYISNEKNCKCLGGLVCQQSPKQTFFCDACYMVISAVHREFVSFKRSRIKFHNENKYIHC